MDSPYHPGFGARPAVFVGRDTQVARARTVLTRVVNSGLPASSMLVLVGPRGLGKTVLLDVIAEEAIARQMLPVQVGLDSVSDAPRLLAGRLAVAAEGLAGGTRRAAWQSVRRRLAQLSVEVNAGVVKISSPPSGEHPDSRATSAREHLAELMVTVADLAVQSGRRGLVVLIDELQQARLGDLVIITNALQDALRGHASPMAAFGAGLPNTPDRVAEASSFAERFEFRPLQRLTPEQAERALIEPALQRGVTWAPEAGDAVVAAAGGSPYLVQLFGDAVWQLADPAPEQALSLDQTVAALADAREGLAAGLFRSRWAKTTGAERELLVALARTADDEGVSEARDYTSSLGKTSQQLSPSRQSLLDKGLVESPARGRLRFTIQGFGEYVLSRVDLSEEDGTSSRL